MDIIEQKLIDLLQECEKEHTDFILKIKVKLLIQEALMWHKKFNPMSNFKVDDVVGEVKNDEAVVLNEEGIIQPTNIIEENVETEEGTIEAVVVEETQPTINA